MKHLILFSLLGFCLFMLLQSLPAQAQSYSDQPQAQETVSPFSSKALAGEEDMQQPQGGVRRFLPLFFLVIIYLFIRRMKRTDGEDRGNPFGSGRDFDEQSGSRPPGAEPEQMKDAYDNARKMWDTFNARPGQDVPAGEPRPVSAGKDSVPEVGGKVIAINGKRMEPASADGDEEFLRGARLVFERVVEAMDGLDPDAAAQFAGPAIVNEIKHRMNDEHPPAASEVVRVDAKVMSRSVEDGVASVTVYYDAVKNVSGIGPVGPVPIREIWTFTKDDTNPEAMWMLVSMEPVEA